MQVVWFKRDLRTVGHAPLIRAVKHQAELGPVLCLFVHETSWEQAPDTSPPHIHFLRECVTSLRDELSAHGLALMERTGEALDVLRELNRKVSIQKIWSYQETTGIFGFERDKSVLRWTRKAEIPWEELPQNGVWRGAPDGKERFDFAAHAKACLHQSLRKLPATVTCASGYPELAGSFSAQIPSVAGEDKPLRQKGGRKAALAALSHFFEADQLQAYPSAISSPLSAMDGCSRLSPYLSFGVVSDQEVLLKLQGLLTKHAGDEPTLVAKLDSSAKFFMERMYWRSAYLQCFERVPESEFQDDTSAFRGLRESELVAEWLEAWKQGMTGYPFIDAGMRMLARTGWLNMRLRGAVTSFAVNELWLPWKEVGLHLAREFLDYEPGIHWNQLQIHAGCSRLSGPLHYNPTKQAQDHDPSGEFIRKWVPELKGLKTPFIYEPWTLPPDERPVDYPAPLVSFGAAHEASKERVRALREGRAAPQRLFWKQRAALITRQNQTSLF